MPAIKNPGILKNLRKVSLIEGASTLILFFVAMPLKYYANIPEAVTLFGSLHGILFLALVGFFIVAKEMVPLSFVLMVAGILGAVIPFGPFVVDRYLKELEKESSPNAE